VTEQQTIKTTVRQIVGLLVKGDYKAVEHLSNGCRLKAEEIAESISDYGETLTMPPDEEFNSLDVVQHTDKYQKGWSVYVDLWTVESGKSDLTLELTLKENEKQTYHVEIDNIHVL
jgi:hypothetical protein